MGGPHCRLSAHWMGRMDDRASFQVIDSIGALIGCPQLLSKKSKALHEEKCPERLPGH